MSQTTDDDRRNSVAIARPLVRSANKSGQYRHGIEVSKGALLFVLVSGYVFESTLNSSTLSYRIVSYRVVVTSLFYLGRHVDYVIAVFHVLCFYCVIVK